MIVDSSAVVAVLRREDDARRFHDVLVAAGGARLSAATYLEIGMVVDGRRDPVASRELDRYLDIVRVEVVDLTLRHARIARQAHRDFGRGSGHPARLNYGDCFSYALATDLDEPLLFKGDDFGHTDVRSALAPR